MLVGNLPSFNSKLNANNDVYRNYDTMSERGFDNEKNRDHFSIFDASRSHYSEYGSNEPNTYMSNGSSGVEDVRTAIRNKVAFFKSSGLIVREQDFEIAYKRTEANNQASNRIILYFNNKTNQPHRISVKYEWEPNYYDLMVSEKVNEVGGLKQAREVVEVQLMNGNDINSVIEANVDIDGRKYKLWLPVMFIQLSKPREGGMQPTDKSTKIVYPSKLFSNEIEAEKIIENL